MGARSPRRSLVLLVSAQFAPMTPLTAWLLRHRCRVRWRPHSPVVECPRPPPAQLNWGAHWNALPAVCVGPVVRELESDGDLRNDVWCAAPRVLGLSLLG